YHGSDYYQAASRGYTRCGLHKGQAGRVRNRAGRCHCKSSNVEFIDVLRSSNYRRSIRRNVLEACGRLFRKLGYKSRDLNYKKGRVEDTPFSLLDIVNRVLLPQFVNIVFITVFVRLLLEGLQNLAYSIRIICRTLIDVWNFGFDYFIA